jgi:hypothetical protein
MTLIACAFLMSLADEATIVTASNETVSAREIVLQVRDGELVADFVDSSGKKGSLKAADLVEINFGKGGAPAPKPAAGDVEITLTTGDLLAGRLGPKADDGIRLLSPVHGDPLVKFEHVRGLVFPANRAHLPKILPKPATDDILLMTSGDQALGTVNAVSGAGVDYKSKTLGTDVTKPVAQVAGLWLVETNAPPKEPETLFAIVLTSDGSSIRGEVRSLQDGVLAFKDLYGAERKVARDAVSGLYWKNGRVVYLSDLQPSAADEDANFIRGPRKSASDLEYPFQRDRSAKGTRLVLGGVEHRKGLGVRARSSLTYSLGGAFKRFQSTVGLDAASQGLGAVVAQVWIDAAKAKEITLKGGDAPQALDLDVAGAKELRLVVTWAGHGQSDFADWGSARLIR